MVTPVSITESSFEISTAALPSEGSQHDMDATPTVQKKLRLEREESMIYLSPNGKFLIDHSARFLHAYEISITSGAGRCSLKVLGTIPNLVVQNLLCIHPQKLMIAFAEESSIMVWDIFRYPRIVTEGSEYGLLIKHIRFSSDGNHLIVTDFESDFPEVYPLDEVCSLAYTAKNANVEVDFDSAEDHIIEGKVVGPPSSKISSTERSLVVGPGRMSDGFTSLVQEDHQLMIQIPAQHTAGAQSQEIPLLDIPSNLGLENSAISVTLPRTIDDTIDVVFNAVSEPWYDFPRCHENRLPVLVDNSVWTR
jgi:hypothetical protein